MNGGQVNAQPPVETRNPVKVQSPVKARDCADAKGLDTVWMLSRSRNPRISLGGILNDLYDDRTRLTPHTLT